MESSSYQVCRPKTSDHRRAMKWFGALTRIVEDQSTEVQTKAGDKVSLQHSVQFFSLFAETGDQRYLELSEDFLKFALTCATPAPATR